MPETSGKPKHQRPTSDIMLETGRKLLTEVEKNAVADSNKHVSMLLARSRSLDVLSLPRKDTGLTSKVKNKNPSSGHAEGVDEITLSPVLRHNRDYKHSNMYVANSSYPQADISSNPAESSHSGGRIFKDECSSMYGVVPDKESTLLKEKSELNNNNRSSCSSNISSSSSNYSSGSSKSNHKLQKKTSSTSVGAAAFQEVVLKSEPIRITGYLEKRSKVLGWKKFWFVLDGRLLTYYKSKADYESLSACCGCINLGIASTVRPIQIRGCKGYPLQIVTRSQVYYLRSQEKPTLEQWLIAIQEAASSPPSTSVLTSWNSYSGSQYFSKNSFSSQSQWSLNNSSDDISNITDRLGNLPDTFYQKRDRDLHASSHVPPVIQKYHSFASLQNPVLNDLGDRRKLLISSTENLRDLQEGKSNFARNSTSSNMQHSTSLLVLDSSPQAAELRKELTRKLYIGSSKDNGNNDGGNEETETVPTPKFLLLSAKKKIQLGPIGDNESHDYAEIEEYMEGPEKKSHKPYENCDVDKTAYVNTVSASIPEQISHNNRNLNRGGSAEKDNNIYEHIETVDVPPNGVPVTPCAVWEPLNEGNNSVSNTKRFPTHRMSTSSNRNSLVSISEVPEDVSSVSPSPIKTPVLSSIPEASWRSGIEPYKNYHKNFSEDDLSSCRSESFRSLPCVEKGKKRKGKAFSGFLSKVFGKGKGKSSKSDSLENLPRPMVISGPVDLRSREMQETQPEIIGERRLPFTATSNVDNRKVNNEQQIAKTSPVIPGSRMTINNTIVMDELKQKVGHITLKRTNSKDGGSGRGSESPPKENIKKCDSMNENFIKARVPYVPRSSSTLVTTPPSRSRQDPVLIFQTEGKSFESNTDDDILTPSEPQNEIQVASICMSPESDTPIPQPDEHLQDSKMYSNESHNQAEVVLCRMPDKASNPEVDFQNKLAKFNRLSQRLSASFIAAAMNPSLHTTLHPIGRSQSYKVNKKGKYVTEIIPPLPPKKKNVLSGGSSGAIAIYDVPLNNKPVLRTSSFQLPSRDSLQEESEEQSIAAYIRGLTKKNSTPDIVISGNNANKFFGLQDDDRKEFRRALNSTSDESIDINKSNPSLLPPRPPKPKPPAKPKSFEFGLGPRSKRSSESSSTSSETVNEPTGVSALCGPPPSIQTLQVLQSEMDSPTMSNKSLDIDTLDALSDIGLSDTKASNSPPDSPKICPLHPESTSRDDLSLSTIARTPESIMTVYDEIVPDSLIGTPDTEIFYPLGIPSIEGPGMDQETSEPISINKLEIVIRDNDGSPALIKSPDNESRLDSLERNATRQRIEFGNSVATSTPSANTIEAYQTIKFATVSTLIQEFETVQENEEEIAELYDDFPADFYTPTPSSFSGYSPSEISSTSTDSPVSSSALQPSLGKKHSRIDSIRNSGMEQLEAFLSFGSSSDDGSFESCTDNFSEEGASKGPTSLVSSAILSVNNNNNLDKRVPAHFMPQGTSTAPGIGGMNRTGAISRLGHSSAIGHLQKILTNDVQ